MRSIVFWVAIASLFQAACGGGVSPQPPDVIGDEYLGMWSGVVDGTDSGRQLLSVGLVMELASDGDAMVLLNLCGTHETSARAYSQSGKTTYFMGEPATCAVTSACGVLAGRAGGVSLRPTDDGRVAVQLSIGVRGCQGIEEVILMSGILGR